MQMENKLYCHWDLVRFVTEIHLKRKDGTPLTLSVIDGKDKELMIFLGKSETQYKYEVCVYKSEKTDKYIPQKYDNVKEYEENDEYTTFFFDNFEDSKNFVDMLGYTHKEYRIRPIRKIEIEEN